MNDLFQYHSDILLELIKAYSFKIERDEMGQGLNKTVFHFYSIPFWNKVATNLLKVSNKHTSEI